MHVYHLTQLARFKCCDIFALWYHISVQHINWWQVLLSFWQIQSTWHLLFLVQSLDFCQPMHLSRLWYFKLAIRGLWYFMCCTVLLLSVAQFKKNKIIVCWPWNSHKDDKRKGISHIKKVMKLWHSKKKKKHYCFCYYLHCRKCCALKLKYNCVSGSISFGGWLRFLCDYLMYFGLLNQFS